MKSTNKHQLAIFTSVIAFSLLMASCTSNNWPQFRGPNSNMIAVGDNLPSEWGNDNNVRWTYEINGDSWSSPVTWGDKVFVASAFPVVKSDTSYKEEVYQWQIACVNLETGDELWKQVAFEGSPRIKKHRATNYASESPVTDGKHVYVYFGMTGLFCYDMEGALVWEKDLGAYNTLRDWGTGSSPVLYKGKLYVQVDNEDQSFLIALDAETGEEVWKVDREEKTNYSTPVIWKNSVRTELVTGGKTARAYDPVTGEVIWSLDMAGHYVIPSGTFDEENLYMGNAGYRDVTSTLFAIKAGAEGDITPAEGEGTSEWVVWSNMDAPLGNPSPLLYNGLLYTISGRGGDLTCIDPVSGDIIYEEKVENVGGCWASPWAHEDKIYFFDEKGVTQVIKAGKEFEVLHQNSLDDKFWASVAVTKDAYLIKGVKELFCIGM